MGGIGVHKGIAKSEITRKIKKLLRPYYKKFDHYYWGRKLNKLGKQYKVKDCKYVGIVTWGLYGVSCLIPYIAFYLYSCINHLYKRK